MSWVFFGYYVSLVLNGIYVNAKGDINKVVGVIMSQRNEDKEPLSEKEVIKGCLGCLNLGCLPFVIASLVIVLFFFN